jgi:hypothetical protein
MTNYRRDNSNRSFEGQNWIEFETNF